jgi:hypothetical protein
MYIQRYIVTRLWTTVAKKMQQYILFYCCDIDIAFSTIKVYIVAIKMQQ